MAKEVKYCRFWVQNTNARCTKRAMWGANYCWWHYSKKALLFEFIIVLVLTLIFNEPIIWLLSKIPLLHRLDKSVPRIEVISPDLFKLSNIEKETRVFKIKYVEKDSGIDHNKSYIRINYKDNLDFIPLEGDINKTASEIVFNVDKKLKFGEYLFEAVLVDKANNRNEFKKIFVIREKEEIVFSATYDIYDKSSYKKLFNDFYESKKDLYKSFDFYIYTLGISNKDSLAIMNNLFITLDMPGVIFFWQEISNLRTKGVKIYNLPEAMNKQIQEGRVHSSQNFLNIDEMGPNGFLAFAILVGETGSEPKISEKYKVWKGIEISGTYVSEGYGTSENRKIKFRIPLEKIKSSK